MVGYCARKAAIRAAQRALMLATLEALSYALGDRDDGATAVGSKAVGAFTSTTKPATTLVCSVFIQVTVRAPYVPGKYFSLPPCLFRGRM